MLSTNLRGGLALILAMGAFVASDSFLKLAVGHLPSLELLAVRTAFSACILLGLIFAVGQGRQLASLFNGWSLARGAAEVGATLCYMLAVFHLPISDVASIVLLAPLLIIIGAMIFYRAKTDSQRLGLLLLGLLGALLVAQPSSPSASIYTLLAFGAPVASAIRDLISRRVPQHIPALVGTLTVLLCIITVTGLGSAVLETFVWPTQTVAKTIALAGIFSIIGHTSMFYAFRTGSPQRVAPFMYSLMLWAIGLGYVFTGALPNQLALIGMVIIAAAGLILIRADSTQKV